MLMHTEGLQVALSLQSRVPTQRRMHSLSLSTQNIWQHEQKNNWQHEWSHLRLQTSHDSYPINHDQQHKLLQEKKYFVNVFP